MDRTQRLQSLRALANHPATPANERENAQVRIRELEERIAVEENARSRSTSEGLRGLSMTLRARALGRLPEEWPPYWHGDRGAVEFEQGMHSSGGIAIGWECPSCGKKVERNVGAIQARELMRRGQWERLLNRYVRGTMNQLCMVCWEKFGGRK